MAGAHEPVIELLDVVGKAAIAAPSQKGPTGVKVGTTGGLTIRLSVALVAQTEPEGVNVSVDVPALAASNAVGDQVPLSPSFEGFGGGGGVSPSQTGAGVGKVGVVLGVMLIVIDAVVTHVPPDGVKV